LKSFKLKVEKESEGIDLWTCWACESIYNWYWLYKYITFLMARYHTINNINHKDQIFIRELEDLALGYLPLVPMTSFPHVEGSFYE